MDSLAAGEAPAEREILYSVKLDYPVLVLPLGTIPR